MPQHKACIPCAESKRRCDRRTPSCERCMKRDIDCVYSQRKKRRRDNVLDYPNEYIGPGSGVSGVTTNIQDVELPGWDWDEIDRLNLTEPLFSTDPALTVLPSLDVSLDSTPTLLDWLVKEVDFDATRPWYLQKDTWSLQSHIKDPTCGIEINYDPYVAEVRSMLSYWSANGHNEFIHRKLYENSMPQCVQEAFTMLSAYFHCSVATKPTILQIAEDQSHRIIQQGISKIDKTEQVMQHLARVHALFASIFLRLFDGSVRLRISAEKQMPTLRSWISSMVDEASRLAIVDSSADNSANRQALSLSDTEFQRMSKEWNAWIIAESVRRTHVIVNSVLNVYLCLSVGAAECSGFLMLTARRGLWQAASASRWSEIVSSASPLLIPIANPGRLIAAHPANDFDYVVHLLWKYMVGAEQIERWIERGEKVAT